MVDFLFLGLDYGDSLNVGFLFGFLDDVKSSLFGLVLDGLFHFLDSLLNASDDHCFNDKIRY
jgi:hypothetical protein